MSETPEPVVIAHPDIDATTTFGSREAFERSTFPAKGWRIVDADAPSPARPAPAPAAGKPAAAPTAAATPGKES